MGDMKMGNELKHLEIPFKDIKLATKKFTQTVIGEGSYGDVYRAELDHFDRKVFLSLEKKKKGGVPPKKRSTVAIKRIKIRKDKQGEEGFDAEIKMLTCCDHQNIVSLLGFCKDPHIILVYEYVSRGSLDRYLGSTDNFLNLNWLQRVKMCIDIAHGLKYLHTKAGRKARIIHRDIKSGNILLTENWEAKIADFGLSKYGTENTKEKSLHTVHIAGTEVYLDPEYEKKSKLTTATDIYSFGVVLFEILSGTLAYDPVYTKEHPRGIAHVARRRLKEGTMNDMVDHRLWETTHENSSTISTRPNQCSLHAFFKVAYRCLEDTQAKRPTAKHIIKKLQDVLCLQETNLKRLPISFIDIQSATQDFSKTYLTGSDAYGKVYTAALDHFDSNCFFTIQEKTRDELHMKSCSTVVIRRILVRKDKQQGFLADIRMLTTYKHPNVVSLLGFCEEGTSIILIYEHASKGSLRDYLGNIGYLGNLTWVQRLEICIDIARGLIYLHRRVEDKPSIIHGHITSGSIFFTENWQAKIADLGLSKFCHKNQKPSTMDKKGNIVHTQVYMDPEYHPSNKQSDIYSFGVILFEILSGRLAYDSIYTKKNTKGIATVAQQRFHNETIEEMVDPRLMEETDENISTLNKRPYLDSLDVFSEIAYKCVAETQARRPSAEEIVKKLEEALSLQENPSDYKKFLLKDIELATHNFSDSNLIGRGKFGNLYKGEVTHANGRNAIAAKRLDMKHGHGEPQFSNELKVLMNNKHENIIGLVGYCKKMNEKILVYEYASRQSLDKHLSDSGLTWMKRLEICIDISSGLDFLHGGEATHKLVMHRDINSSNVLLTDDWKAKISDFRISLIIPINEDIDSVIDKAYGTHGYVDPLYEVSHCLTKESDVYSLGIVLFEILCGRLGYDARRDSYLSQLVEHNHNEGKLGELVFEGIKDQIAPKSLTAFQSIALKCLHRKREERPTTYEVLQQLKKALEFQEDYEIWKPRLPKNYKKIFLQMSNSLDISNQREKDLYNMLCNGVLLEEDKVLFAQDRNGDRNEMISAKTFSYINHCRYRWRSVPESRFRVVAEMLDIMNLNVKIKTKAPNRLSPDVVYGVYLVFKFCDPRTVSTKPVYVNLKYKNGGESAETSHAYFATWRDNEWMMIELCRFLNNRGHIIFKFLLESFSRYYCGDSNIYVQGIEFRAIDNAEHENLEGLMDVQEVLTSNSYVDWIRTLLPFGLPTRLRSIYSLPTRLPSIYGLRTSLSSVRGLGTSQATSITNFFSRNDDAGEQISINVNGKKHHLVSAKAALHNYSEVECFKTQQTDQYRFPEVIELLPQQVFGIKCTIISRMLSRDTNYVCCLVFKLSDTCRGLHCPVKVRDLPHFENKDDEIIYFRSPSPRNLHDSNQAPIPRADGWMEVRIWKFNLNEVLKNYYLSVDLKLISYEGTVSGLIIGGLEFRPIS